MENNEKYIIDQIQGHREDVDIEALWADVSPHIPKEKKKRRVGFWIFGMAVLIALFTFSGILFDGDVESEKLTITDGKVANQDINNNESISKEIATNEKVEKVEKLVHSDLQNKRNGEISAQVLDAKSPSNNKSTTYKVHSNSFADENKNDPNALNSVVKIVSTNETEPGQTTEQIVNSEIVNKNTQLLEFIESSNVRANTSNELLAISILPIPMQNLLFRELDGIEFNHTPLVRVNMQRHLNRYSAYFLTGASFVQRSLTTNSIEFQPERDRRNSIVDVLGSWEVEGGFGMRLSQKLRLSVGLGYTQIHERARFESDYLVDIEAGSNNTVFRQDGSVLNIDGTYAGQGIEHSEETRFNEFKMVRIPIRLSYELMDLDKLELRLGVLGAFGISQGYSGFTSLSATSERYDLDLDLENKFRTSGTISYGLNIEGVTHLSKMLDLTFGIGYQKTQKINNEIYLIDQQYNSLSFTSGLYRRF